MTSGGNNFNDFPDNQLPKFRPLPNRLGALGSFAMLSPMNCEKQMYSIVVDALPFPGVHQ